MAQLSNDIISKLLPYQVAHTANISHSLKTYKKSLDLSDTGTGKTYCAIAACLTLGKKPFIVCPKAVISSWMRIMKFFGIKYYGITNYEALLGPKMYDAKSPDKKILCPYIKKTNNKIAKGDKITYTFDWQNIPDDCVVIYDEAHRCKNTTSYNSKILLALAKTKASILLLSATLIDRPEKFAVFGVVLGLYKNITDSKMWLSKVGEGYDNVNEGIHDTIFPKYASRMKIKDLGKLFPKNKIMAEAYDMDSIKEIQLQYQYIDIAIKQFENKEINSSCKLSQILYCRMKIEMLKVPTYIEEAKKHIDENNSVAIFVNFTDSLNTIASAFDTTCVIHGQQTMDERNKAIDDFNSDISRIIVCNIGSGNAGISLHDTIGNFPRVGIISPSYNGIQVVQSLGRLARANGKTHVRQYIIYCAQTIEEKICENMREKITNIAMLNDTNIDSYCIDGLV